MSFQQELIKSIVNNGLLALIVLAAGVWFSWRLEKYKVEIAQQSEFMKLRMAAMNSFWSDIYAWMNACDGYFANMMLKEPLEALKPADTGRYRKFIQEKTEELFTKLASQRFFCGVFFTRDSLVFVEARYKWYIDHGVGPHTPETPSIPIPPWESIESLERKYLRPNSSN